MQRRSFIIFCKHAVAYLPRDFVKQNFIEDYIRSSQDKVPMVRREFASAMFIIKPYFDSDIDLSLELMDVLQHLNKDPDQDVVEEVETADYNLLQNRSKNQERDQETENEEKVQFMKQLALREKEEMEERKRRMDEDEESKFDINSFLNESKRWKSKASKYQFAKRPYNSINSSKALLAAGTNALRKIQLTTFGSTEASMESNSKKSTKRSKNATSNKKSGATKGDGMLKLPDKEFKKERKNSMLAPSEFRDKKYKNELIANGRDMLNLPNTKLANSNL